jgi:subtilisin family serine protease
MGLFILNWLLRIHQYDKEDETLRTKAERLLGKTCLTVFLVLFFSLIFLNATYSEELRWMKEENKGHPKIQSALIDLKNRYLSQEKSLIQEFAKRRHIRMDEQDRVTVLIQPKAGNTQEAIDTEALKALGGEVIKKGHTVIKAKIPISMMDVIADKVEGVSFIRLPDRPYAEVVSQGVGLTGASTYHTLGYGGQNVKVAVIDLGFEGLSAAISSGELPASVVKIDCTAVVCIPTKFSSETEEHGTAVAEIVYDMAPNADLYLIKIEDSIDLLHAKDYCSLHGINIINHSVGWFNANFYDGACYFDNPVCTADQAYSNGILWVNSAGNHAKRHFGATFMDSDGDRLHNVTKDSNTIAIDAQGGDMIITTLTWDAWPETDQDYDLLLYNSSMDIVETSEGVQNGTQPPAEAIVYSVPTSGTYYLAIKKSSATENHRFKVFSILHDLNPYVASSSLLSPSDAKGVMAVAAIDQANWTTGPQENFSSQGPTTDGRIKPEISGPDGVSSSIYGSFFGTSASSPHVAGAAALILSLHPTSLADQLWDAITSNAIDMGMSGQDAIYGFGRLNLPSFNPTLSVDPSSVNFGEVFVESQSEKSVTIKNIGNTDLTIGIISSPSAPYHITEDQCSGETLSFETSCVLTIQFLPTSGGVFNSFFGIPSNDPFKSAFNVFVSGTGKYEIELLSPWEQASFTACSLYTLPTFTWSARVPFTRYEIQFSGDNDFKTLPVRISVYQGLTEHAMTSREWKKVLSIPEGNGGTVFWRVVGTQSDGTKKTSEVRSIKIVPAQPVGNPSISPTQKKSTPMLTWENNCNKKFKVWFGSNRDFNNNTTLSFNVSTPTDNGGVFTKALTSYQWTTIKRLAGNVSGALIYWYVESSDGLSRTATTEVMSFTLKD